MARQTKSDSRDWLRLGLESLGDAVLTTDAAGRITYLNAAAERLIGASGESPRGIGRRHAQIRRHAGTHGRVQAGR